MIIKYYYPYSTSGGAVSFNTNDIRGILRRFLVIPLTSTTNYDISLTDDNSLLVYSKKGITGTLNDVTPQSLKGVHTCAIANSTANELFKIQIEYSEIPS